MIEPTDEMRQAYVDRSDPWADPDEIMDARLAAVLAIVERDQLRGIPLADEPVWTGSRAKRITVEMESVIEVEGAELGVADRPSEVVRMLRQAAADIELAWRQAKGGPT